MRITWRIVIGIALYGQAIISILEDRYSTYTYWLNNAYILAGLSIMLWQVFFTDRKYDITEYPRPGTRRCKACGRWYPIYQKRTRMGVDIYGWFGHEEYCPDHDPR